jgi:hypothetical protein
MNGTENKMTSPLTTYEQFLARVETLGFLPLSQLCAGLPSLGGETDESAWHTGLETDPWQWKDRSAVEKRLAYGCILGGNKGFIARRLYPLFYAACHPAESMPERWAAGAVNARVWKIWQLFEEHGAINVSRLRQILGEKGSAVDSALEQLQCEFYITVDGNDRKLSAKGEPYGWPVIRYRRVVDWAPAGWLDESAAWPRTEARQSILNAGAILGVDREELVKKLGFKG